MTQRLRVTPRALAEIDAAGRYMLRVWGDAQAVKYLAAIDRRMRWLAADPRRGRPREEAGPGYHSCPQGGHLIFYVISGGELIVIGLPHQAMDLHAHLEGDPE